MARLTKAQQAFMADLGTAGDYVECPPHEWRTAQSLARRGLCTIERERNEMGFFEARAALKQSEGVKTDGL